MYYLLRKSTSGTSELWYTEWASGKSNLALPGVSVADFDISRDGQQVAFTSVSGNEKQIFIAPLDGSAPPRQVTRDGDTVSFGPPGELVFRQLGAKVNDLARVKVDGTGLAHIIDQAIEDKLSVSPDGVWAVVGAQSTLAISLSDGTRKKLCNSLCLVNWPTAGGYVYLTTDPTIAAGLTVALPVPRGKWFPDLPESGFSVDADGKIPGSTVVRLGHIAPGANPNTYAFAKLEFVGNLFRIPLH